MAPIAQRLQIGEICAQITPDFNSYDVIGVHVSLTPVITATEFFEYRHLRRQAQSTLPKDRYDIRFPLA